MNDVKHLMISTRESSSVEHILSRYRPLENEHMKIQSAFGFCGDEPCRMFGGRDTKDSRMTWKDVEQFNRQGISFSVTLTNHFFDTEAVNHSFKLIERLLTISEENSVVILNRKYAKLVRAAFPSIVMKQSAIADARTLPAIEKALELYDLVNLSHNMYDEREFVMSLPKAIKNRLIMFAVGRCAYKCYTKTCYTGCSQEQFGKPVTQHCTGHGRVNDELVVPTTWFDLSDPIFTDIPYLKYTVPDNKNGSIILTPA